MTTVARNIAANAAGAGLSFVVFLIAVPLYLRLLGAEAYGLVGLFTTVMVAAAALDLGLGATLNREVARLTARDGRADGHRGRRRHAAGRLLGGRDRSWAASSRSARRPSPRAG